MLIILLGSGKGLENGVRSQFESSATNTLWIWGGQTTKAYKGIKPGRSIEFENADYNNFKKNLPGIGQIAGRSRVWGDNNISYKNEYGNFEISTVHPDYQIIEKVEMVEGRFVNEFDVQKALKVTAISTAVKQALFKDKPALGEYIKVKGIPFKVVGVWKELGDNQLVGVIALLIAVSCYGASYPYSTRNVIPLKLKPEALAAGQLIMAAITLLPLFLINGISNNSYPRQSVVAMLCLGIFGSGFAYIWNFSITAAAGSAIASSVTYLTPVVAVIVGRLYLGEVIVWHEIVGAIIVILGALLSQGRLNRLVKSK